MNSSEKIKQLGKHMEDNFYEDMKTRLNAECGDWWGGDYRSFEIHGNNIEGWRVWDYFGCEHRTRFQTSEEAKAYVDRIMDCKV